MKKIIKRVSIILLTLIVVLAVGIGFHSYKNSKAMNNTIEIVMDQIALCGELKPVDHEYEHISLNSLMNFDVKKYELEGVGNVSVMTTNMGFMQMGTVVVSPYKKDVPLLSTDFMYILGNKKYIIEMDNTVIDSGDTYKEMCDKGNSITDKYDNLKYFPSEPSWLDEVQDVLVRKQSTNTKELDALVNEQSAFYANWLNSSSTLNENDEVLKREATKNYSDKLISQGGISTDMFKKYLGEEVTSDFFNTVFFNTEGK